MLTKFYGSAGSLPKKAHHLPIKKEIVEGVLEQLSSCTCSRSQGMSVLVDGLVAESTHKGVN